jgi:hypothetical protein
VRCSHFFFGVRRSRPRKQIPARFVWYSARQVPLPRLEAAKGSSHFTASATPSSSQARASVPLGVSASVLRGTATNLSTPNDLAGTYTGSGVGAAVAAGVSAVKLRNDKGVVLELRGAKFGVEASANLPLVSITMK